VSVSCVRRTRESPMAAQSCKTNACSRFWLWKHSWGRAQHSTARHNTTPHRTAPHHLSAAVTLHALGECCCSHSHGQPDGSVRCAWAAVSGFFLVCVVYMCGHMRALEGMSLHALLVCGTAALLAQQPERPATVRQPQQSTAVGCWEVCSDVRHILRILYRQPSSSI
jgi:hypothetical protein